jgi:hypothetical protein
MGDPKEKGLFDRLEAVRSGAEKVNGAQGRFKICWISVERFGVADQEWLSMAEGGWLRRASDVVYLPAAPKPIDLSDILAGEAFSTKDDRSWRIDASSRDVIQIEERLAETKGATPALFEKVTLFGPDGSRALTYHIFWTARDGGPIRRAAWRLVSMPSQGDTA